MICIFHASRRFPISHANKQCRDSIFNFPGRLFGRGFSCGHKSSKSQVHFLNCMTMSNTLLETNKTAPQKWFLEATNCCLQGGKQVFPIQSSKHEGKTPRNPTGWHMVDHTRVHYRNKVDFSVTTTHLDIKQLLVISAHWKSNNRTIILRSVPCSVFSWFSISYVAWKGASFFQHFTSWKQSENP